MSNFTFQLPNSKFYTSCLLRCLQTGYSLCAAKFKKNTQRGFTIIELLVVISIMAIIAVVSIASFSSYNTSQKLTTAALNVKNMLQYAKSQAASQVNTCPGSQQFAGYEVLMCCTQAGCPTCNNTKNYSYETDIMCSGGNTFVSGENLPVGVTVDTKNSTTLKLQFAPSFGNVTGAGTVIVKQGTSQKSIVISSTGVIQ